jgi:hypothetical protein
VISAQVMIDAWKTLEDIDNFFVQLVSRTPSKFDISKIKQRLSIFAPNHDMSYLVCSEFRRSCGRNGNQRNTGKKKTNKLNERGSTRYAIDPKRPIGPLGVAYSRKKSIAVNSLPDYQLDPEAYERRLKTKPFFLDSKTISNFGRHARSFLSIPFAFSDQVDFVICIDCEAPLDNISKKELEEIGRWILVAYELRMASLWRLRT